MKLVVCLALFFSSFSFGQSFPHISELMGVEDSLNNTHLFYRYVYPTTVCWSKSIYHLDVTNGSDTFFIYDAASDPIGEGCRGQYVYDYEFFDNDPAKYIYGGYDYYIDPAPLLVRYDGVIQLPGGGIGGITEVEISHNNDSLVYAALGGGLFKSTDGGYNFTIDLDSLAWIDNSMISLSRNNDSQIYGINDSKLVRSEDEGYSYIIVDNADWRDNSELFYDADGEHIYGLSIFYNYQTHSYNSTIYKSSDNGNPFTWNTLLEYPGKIWFTLDDIQAGEIYYSAGKQIFKSTDFGATFNPFKELAFKITGLYKKSGTNTLYASTTLKIYEIAPDTIQVIKSLPIPDEVLNFYPLAVGNKWVYDNVSYLMVEPGWIITQSIVTREVVGDTVMQNGKRYYWLKDYFLNPTHPNIYERIDSVEGKVYRYDEFFGLPDNEYLIDDLLAEIGDTVWSSRQGYQEYYPTTVIEIDEFKKWGLTKNRNHYRILDWLYEYNYTLTHDIGLDSVQYYGEWFVDSLILKGCIINGTVYGDTTLVSVEDETPIQPIEFSLGQNYPNPFNPTTTIRFSMPTSPLNPSPYQGEGQRERLITLKVYDILGREVATLVNEEKSAGNYEVKFDRSGFPSGIYFYQLRAGSSIETKKMLLLK